MATRTASIASLTLLLAFSAFAEKADRLREALEAVRAVRLHERVSVDARLDEPARGEAPVITDFIQSTPAEGASPTERTAVRLLYVDEALQVRARMFDDAPDSINANLGRRDVSTTTDLFGIVLGM